MYQKETRGRDRTGLRGVGEVEVLAGQRVVLGHGLLEDTRNSRACHTSVEPGGLVLPPRGDSGGLESVDWRRERGEDGRGDSDEAPPLKRLVAGRRSGGDERLNLFHGV